MSNMKKFGLEFVIKDNATRQIKQFNRELEQLERTMKTVVPATQKLDRQLGSINTSKSVNHLTRLTATLQKYKKTLEDTNKQNVKMPNGTIPGDKKKQPTGLMMGADYYRDTISGMANSMASAFSAMPFGSIMAPAISSTVDGIATSLATGSIGPAIVGMITGGVESAVSLYTGVSNTVHQAIYSAFQKGTQLITQAIAKFVPQTLQRGYDQTKLSAVLGDDDLAKKLNEMGVNYAKNSSLSLQDMDFILPNLVMANKASGLTNKEMEKSMKLQMDAITRLNFKDSGQGAGVQGSLVAIQEMLAGDYISLARRFEVGGGSVDRIKEAAAGGVNAQMEQLIKELNTMGVTDDALKKMQESTKFKLDYIGESLTDFFTNPHTGIMASFIKPFEPLVDKVVAMFEGDSSAKALYDKLGGADFVGNFSMLDSIQQGIGSAFGTLGDFIVNFGEALYNGFILKVDWAALGVAVSSLLSTIATYFEPAFNTIANWVNDTFIPWLDNINALLKLEKTKKAAEDFVKHMTDIASESLKIVESIVISLPEIAAVSKKVGDFMSTVRKTVETIGGFLTAPLKMPEVTLPSTGMGLPPKKPKEDKPKKGHAKGSPFVPVDDYPALLHRGERVLTAQQNKQYDNLRAGNSANGIVIPKLADSLVIREEADIDKIAGAIARKIKEAQLGFGGAY